MSVATPTGSSPTDLHLSGLLHDSDLTRVRRVRTADGGTVVRKEMLGANAVARASHEHAILVRLAGVDAVSQLAGDHAHADRHGLTLVDVSGRALAELPPSERPDIAGLPAFALALARILGPVHRAAVVHRDINPANILLRRDGRPVLIDFDLATTFAEVRPAFTHHTEILGRLPYLAPEQTGRTGLPVDSRADLYGLGATLYELAAGHPPFGDGDPLQLVRDILTRTPRPLAELVPGVSRGLSDIVARLLEKEPARRYQSAEGLVHDLTRVVAAPQASLRLGERDFPSRLSPPSTVVGRDTESAALRSAFEQAVHGRPTGLLVTGAPGAGKSALISQLRPMVTAAGGWFVTGKADQYRHDAASGVAVQALHGIGRLLLAEPEDELAQHRTRILAALGPNAGLIAAASPELATLLGDHEIGIDDPMELQARLRQAALDLLRAIASPQRPLVLVLDDLQWASPSALGIVDAVQTDSHLRGLLLVGAYRDREVDAAHPLTALFDRWQRLGVAPVRLHLDNLGAGDLGTLVGQMLRLPAEPAAELAGVLRERTGGNPFDTVELINALRGDGTLELGESGWRWDSSAIRRHIGSGNVVDLLTERIGRLAESERELLRVMACLGGSVRLDLLARASGHRPETTRERLTAALDDALLVLDDDGGMPTVRFRHDRVQEAARHDLDPTARPATHLAIAWRLAVDRAFRGEAAEQYLAAGPLLRDVEPAERRTAAALCGEAAAAARLISNHSTAEQYLSAALGLWATLDAADDDPLAIAWETQRHGALYSLGRLDEADEAYGSLEHRAPDPLALVDAACNQISSLSNRYRHADAVSLGFALLNRIGYAPPGDDAGAEARRRLDAMYRWIETASVTEDLARPEPTDPRALAAARVLQRLAPVALFAADPVALAWVVTGAHRLWTEHGACAALVPTIASAGFATIQIGGEHGVGERLVQHALAVGVARGYETETAQARYINAVGTLHWFQPLEDEVRQARLAREGLLRGGDLHSVCMAYWPSLFALVDTGPTLDDLDAEVDAALAFAARTGNDNASAIQIIYRQFALAMRGRTSTPGGFSDDTFDELRHLEVNKRVALHYFMYRALSAIIFDDSDVARYTDQAARLAPMLRACYTYALTQLLQALALARQLRGAEPDARPALLAALDGCRDFLAERANDAPENFRHLLRLVEAERAWAVDDFRAAATAFDAALGDVEPRQRPWHRALIAERAGLFHLGHGLPRTGRGLLAEAREHYRSWGAAGKVHQLDRAHPDLPTSDAAPARQALSTSVRGDDIDLLAVLRASQALSSETDLDRLQARVVEQVGALAGATTIRLALFDTEAGRWMLPNPDRPGDAPVPVSTPGTERLVPVRALHYVERTREPLLVADTAGDDRFASDPYLTDAPRGSLLVVPVLQQGALRAALVLENRLSVDAFTTDRLGAVTLLAGQLAVSLDNAQLYRRLETKVAERTSALQAANEQLAALSLTDALTGLANRRRFDDALEATWTQARETGTAVTLAMIDIDHFKWYNDSYGHQGGDECLRRVAAELAGTVRQGTDIVCRYGGEEFAIVFTGADHDRATAVAERARAAVEALALPHERTEAQVVTLSIGVATHVPATGGSAHDLVEAADAALYCAKEAGRNQLRVATPTAHRGA
ncbi:diguanylate cyclase (GGDEF)-like protein [Krasilnikovia cinnamomea]|uniref:Diguanylate cyclase (GGDEF)-like protein n=1 Tax=Krasilnikovia cinnamomea TaxID=349313 RepID=A0A4Q7ZT00_9ACTN|nr:diguanylate cyclase [Krasilnikovia cinnamomea]RZU53619.1 diguanylate cyclase (GGDEF)-like protein [Krasilnikovia cinnamomea]